MSDPPPKKIGSLRDRIAAFEKGNSTPGPAPAPAPRPKPGNLSWKPRPPSPSTEPSTTATDDAVVEKKTGGMSASDAKESIGKGGSLKDRMAALQGHGAFGAPAPPPIAPKPAVERPKWKPPPPVASPPQDEEDAPAVVSKSPEIPIRSPPVVAEKVEDETTDAPAAEPDQEEPADVDAEEEERQRRAALAARMARLGGARVGMGPPVFGKKPTPKSTPASESPAKEIATTDEASVKSPDSTDTSAKSPPAEAKATEYFPATAGAQSADSEPPASGKSADSLVPESSPSIPPRSPNAMPVPAVPRRAAPPRRKAAKSPARPPADEPATVKEPLPDVPPVPKDDDTFSINVDDPPEVKEPIVTRSSQELTDAERRFSMDIASSDMDSTPSVAADPTPVSPQTMEADVTEVGYRRDDTPPPPSPIRDDPAPAKETDDSTETPLPDAEEEEEDEEAKRKRVAERIAKMGGVNPFAPPAQRKASTDAEVSQPSEPVEAVKEEEEAAVSRDVVPPAPERKSSIDVESQPTVPQKRSSVSSVQSAEKRKASIDEDILPPIRKDSVEEPKGPVPPSQTDEPESERKDEEETKTGAEEPSDAFREPSDDGEDDEFLDAEDEDDSKIPSISPPITRSLDPPSQHGTEEEDEPPTPPEKASILKANAEDDVIPAASPPPLPVSRPPPVPKSTRPPVPPSDEEEEEAPPPPPPRRLSIRKVDDSPEEPPRAISPLSEVAESPVQVSAVPRHLSKVDTDDDEPPASPSPLQVPPPRRFSTDRHDVPLPPPPSHGEDDEEQPRQIPHRALPQTPLAEQDEEVYDESEEEALPTPPPPPRRTTLPPPPPPSAIDPPSPSKSDDEPSATPISHEILDDDEGDPIDPGFYSPPRTSNAAPVVSTTEPEAPPVDEEQERRRTIAERMARLGGIKFGAPPVPMTRAHPAPQRRQTQDHAEGDTVSPTTTGEEEAPAELTEEEEERARKERIAAKMATMGGQRIGMMPGFMPPPHRAPPMPKAPPPTQQSYAETDSEHESQDGVKVEAEESEIEEVSHEEAMEEAPPPVPTRAGRRQMSMDSNTSHGTEESTPRIPSGRPPVPTGPPPRRASVQTTRSKRSSTGGESFDTSTRPPPVPQTDFVMVEEPEELPPPPPPSRPPPPRAAVPPPPPLDASDNLSASQQWELPSIPTSSLEFSAGGDLSMSWQDDLVESTTTASAPPPPEKRGSHVPSMNPDDVVLTPEDLTAVWGRIGVQVCEVATALYERSKTSLIGDGTYHGFVNAVLSQVPGAASAHPPSYGYTIYTQNGTNVQKRAGDIMPGDIVWLSDAKLKGHKGLQTYSQHVGVGGEALVGVIGEFEPKKFKIRAFQANQHVGQQTVEAASYRLEDLKSGVVKIFRVLEA